MPQMQSVEFLTASSPTLPCSSPWAGLDALCSALRAKLEMPVLVLHGASDHALGEDMLDGIEAAAPKVRS